jgi:hypothetical protein
MICLGAAALWLAGCQERQPRAPLTGTYGNLTNTPSANTTRARPDRSAEQPWTNGTLSVTQTELSPATLYYSTAKTFSLFANMPETGIGGPTFAAIETQQGPKIFRHGDVIDPARMRESWFVVWWAGATNWTNWDSPWFVTLQHRPQSIRFDSNGLHFTFATEAGYAAAMPLYGYYKPLQAGQEASPFVLLKEKKKRVLTWEWHLALPADPLARAMYWASALKEFPIYCEDDVSVDRAHDSVVLRQKFRFLSWNDDWNTKHLKLVPVSPVLALAVREGFPAQFSRKPSDMEIFTPWGPYYGIENADEYSITLPVLRYVNATEGAGSRSVSPGNAPAFEAWQTAHAGHAWEAVRQRWPALRAASLRNSPGSWAAFGHATDRSIFEQTADALGAARIAYKLGDIDGYADASESFARSLIQLCAQHRGGNYFRQNQPWHSMEPIGTDAVLTGLTMRGWDIGNPAATPDFSSAPDLARIWRDSQPMNKNAPVQKTGTSERLIPGGPATPFVPGLERTVAGPNTFLAYESEPGAGQNWRAIWPQWRMPNGAPWHFGQVTVSSNAPAAVHVIDLNWNTRVTILDVP